MERKTDIASEAATGDLVTKAFDPKNHLDLARAVEQLTPDEAAFFVDQLNRAIKKRKIQLLGYLVAVLGWFIGMTVAVIVWSTAAEGHFVGWVFVLPFLLVGAALYGFGRWGARTSNPS